MGDFLLGGEVGLMDREHPFSYNPAEERSFQFNIPPDVAKMEIIAAQQICERVFNYTPEADAKLPEQILEIVEKINNGQEVKPEELPRKKEERSEANSL